IFFHLWSYELISYAHLRIGGVKPFTYTHSQPYVDIPIGIKSMFSTHLHTARWVLDAAKHILAAISVFSGGKTGDEVVVKNAFFIPKLQAVAVLIGVMLVIVAIIKRNSPCCGHPHEHQHRP